MEKKGIFPKSLKSYSTFMETFCAGGAGATFRFSLAKSLPLQCVIAVSVSHAASKLRLFPTGRITVGIFREKMERWRSGGGRGGGAGKEPELAALNTGNFPAIWLAFRKEEKVSEAGGATVRKLLFIF